MILLIESSVTTLTLSDRRAQFRYCKNLYLIIEVNDSYELSFPVQKYTY